LEEGNEYELKDPLVGSASNNYFLIKLNMISKYAYLYSLAPHIYYSYRISGSHSPTPNSFAPIRLETHTSGASSGVAQSPSKGKDLEINWELINSVDYSGAKRPHITNITPYSTNCGMVIELNGKDEGGKGKPQGRQI
jgi:hypothetical protein